MKFDVVIPVNNLILLFNCEELRHNSEEIISMILSVLVISLYINVVTRVKNSGSISKLLPLLLSGLLIFSIVMPDFTGL